ncbi:hypothetical protein EQU24_00025 [Methylotuvimicrobium buryatense]|uniref:Uncharacterized protein n=1 Tax=Methylotuvimicrobium buryatense TaxID=95641 RepID=A0A4P9UJZ0_METBY|nr:hypothetical protein EQU24_00025 [Methylotuvimicrobium buryatense]
MKTTKYFLTTRMRPDREIIKDEWIQYVVRFPENEHIQFDGRIRRWARIEEMGGRYPRVILLPDGETVHNAFIDRGYKP